MIFLPFAFGGHLEDISQNASGDTSPKASTDNVQDLDWKKRAEALKDIRAEAEQVSGLWRGMYSKDPYARARVMKSTRLLLPYLKPGDTVLDVGCFTQEPKKYLPYDVKYIGIDGEKFHKDTQVMDLNSPVSLPKSKALLCLETLEHLVNPKEVLRLLHHSLQEDGRLVVSLPNEATIFHRFRCLYGTVDAECFQGNGKHLHLPTLRQSRALLSSFFQIESELYYIAPTACGTRQEWVGRILRLIPDAIHQFLADRWPSLFARGFIFLCRKRVEVPTASGS